MEDQLIHAVEGELNALYNMCLPGGDSRLPGAAAERFRGIAVRTAGLTAFLAGAPYLPARKTAEMMGMDRHELVLSYKLIQRTRAAADLIRLSPNGDYLNIVKHYFAGRMYVVVFFTGLACPGRCRFCPNVSVSNDGTRRLALYPGGRSKRLSPEKLDAVFEDISEIMARDTSILVKISGGLEPLTDPDTMAAILDRAGARRIPVKLFTNGMLLNSPEQRRLALRARDVRISLSMADEDAYAEVMFGSDPARRSRFGLPAVLENLRRLVRDRDRHSPDTRIGLNTIVLEENHRSLSDFIGLAKDLGLDYIDFKPNYFSPYAKETQDEITARISRIKTNGNSAGVRTYFAGSLSGDNLFWRCRDGQCHPQKQSRYKMFITPHGLCSPVHYGAFPGHPDGDNNGTYTIGWISRECSLLDIIGNEPPLPGLSYEKLNPFEHMLALEIERVEADRAWGIPDACNPYHFEKRDQIPDDIANSPLLTHF